MIGFCLVGAGRIGAIHAANIASLPQARLLCVVDAIAAPAAALAQQYEARHCELDQALADPAVDAVLIASSTDTHVDFIVAAAAAGKAIFCEKPIDLDLPRVRACIAEVERAGTVLALGFNRRFDPGFSALYERLRRGDIGTPEIVSITSRDPQPPPLDYLRRSGGLFMDMMIHDLDMARWLLLEEPCEIYATGSCLVDAAIGEAGDIDTATVILKTASGRLCQISNSRRTSYGYDQRLEVHGSQGMLRAENVTATRLQHYAAGGVVTDPPLHFFLQRYADAYRLELLDFIEAVSQQRPPAVTGEDGLRAQELATAALESLQQGRPLRL
ncbi:inositol 2-dehydrogenase [Kineobactrum salinum]|uniref:Inositol 2-dehydrogenase n=1 Tax=Kineobactrum salinum TaxID=2708301 RepID=A0A6C0TWS7_9GAMM|nr:inositol 2-dehydrogenase [Kineobactrum salinum]QIB64282.1 inositol 2-dehydrogenase [Kineobactrum salinum]